MAFVGSGDVGRVCAAELFALDLELELELELEDVWKSD